MENSSLQRARRFVKKFLLEGFSAFSPEGPENLEEGLAALEMVLRVDQEDLETRACQHLVLAELALHSSRLSTARGALEDARDLVESRSLPDLDLLLLERNLHLLRENPRKAAKAGREAMLQVANRGTCLLPWHEWDRLASAEAPEVRSFLDALDKVLPVTKPGESVSLNGIKIDALAGLGARLADLEPWLQDPMHLLQLVPEVTERIGSFPSPEARAWITRLRASLAPHQDLSFLPQLEGQLAWLQGALAGSAGELKEASEALERAVLLLDDVLSKKDNPPARAGGSSRVTLLQQTADCLLELDRLDEAEKYYLEARRDSRATDRDAFALGWGLGRVYFFQNRYAEAFRELRRATKAFDWAEPRWIGARGNESSAYERLGQLRQDLEEMLEESREAMQQPASSIGKPLRA
jgi:tetratricopeptide (TPR) repeat protein